jgi:ATP-dependent protease HslVU (ClpYQ) peptidase subunit
LAELFCPHPEITVPDTEASATVCDGTSYGRCVGAARFGGEFWRDKVVEGGGVDAFSMVLEVTCIIGVVEKKAVHIIGDSAGISGYSLTIRADEKVFVNGGFVFGFTSSFRMGQVLRYGFSPPLRRQGMDIYEYMVTDSVEAVRSRFKFAGYLEATNGRESGGSFLVGHEGHLFRVDSDFQIGESTDGYDAIGCGAEIGLGAMYAMKAVKGFQNVKIALTKAIQAAENHSSGVRGPFTIVSVGCEK